MDDKHRLALLENLLEEMLKPVKGVPFYLVVRSTCGKKIIKFDQGDPDDVNLLLQMTEAVVFCAQAVNATPIRRPRPNEVGNDIEAFVIDALKKAGMCPVRPTTIGGKAQSTGYPDILLFDGKNRPTYLECKIFAESTEPTTMRSFYFSPSEKPKVSLDARHLLLAFGMEATAIDGSRDSYYRPKSFKLVDLHDLQCDVKYEFNSDNRRLYDAGMILKQGKL